MRGGIPERDLDALGDYWGSCLRCAPRLNPLRPGYFQLKTPIAEVKPAILGHPEFVAFNDSAIKLFEGWKDANTPGLKTFAKDGHPKAKPFPRASSLTFDGPINAQGAMRPSCRSAPTKVVVFQWPQGTGATRRWPRGHRP